MWSQKNSKKYYPDIIFKKEITGQHWYIRTQIHKNIVNSLVLGFTVIFTLDKTETPQSKYVLNIQITSVNPNIWHPQPEALVRGKAKLMCAAVKSSS